MVAADQSEYGQAGEQRGRESVEDVGDAPARCREQRHRQDTGPDCHQCQRPKQQPAFARACKRVTGHAPGTIKHAQAAADRDGRVGDRGP